MKILVIHDRYQQAGGENAAVDAQVELLRGHGHEVILYQRDNKEIEKYSGLKKLLFFFFTLYSFRTVKEIKKIVREEHPDIAQIHNVFPLISPSVYRTLKKEEIPFVQTTHNFRFLCPNGLFFTHGRICESCKMGHYGNAIRWKCYRDSFVLSFLYSLTIWFHRKIGSFNLASGFIIVNPFTRQKLLEAGLTAENKIHFIPNSIPPMLFNESEMSHGAGIVYLGRLSAEKGVEDLLSCLEFVPDLWITIAGTGAEESGLAEKAVAYPGRVRFAGFLTGESKMELIEHTLAFVIPSRCYEQFPVVALEVMAAGKPLIVPDLGGWRNLVRNGEIGLLYESGNIADLAAKIRVLVKDPELADRMGKNARKEFEENYSSEVHYRKLISLYRNLVSQKAGKS